MTKFGAPVSCYLTTWDDIRAVAETMETGRWYRTVEKAEVHSALNQNRDRLAR